jgi:hypothetical protein
MSCVSFSLRVHSNWISVSISLNFYSDLFYFIFASCSFWFHFYFSFASFSFQFAYYFIHISFAFQFAYYFIHISFSFFIQRYFNFISVRLKIHISFSFHFCFIFIHIFCFKSYFTYVSFRLHPIPFKSLGLTRTKSESTIVSSENCSYQKQAKQTEKYIKFFQHINNYWGEVLDIYSGLSLEPSG